MEWFVRAFLKASLAWLAVGVTVGVAMAAHPVWTIYRLAHVHMLLLGFVTMMIYGVAYHVIPRFSGHPLHGRRAAGWHWWGSNVGLGLLATGFVARVHDPSVGTPLLAAGGALSALGAYVFAYLLWRTIDGGAGRAGVVPMSGLGRRRVRETRTRISTLPPTETTAATDETHMRMSNSSGGRPGALEHG